MSQKNNIISLIAFREKKQKFIQTKKKVSNAPTSIETKKNIDFNAQKEDKIIHMPEYRAKKHLPTESNSKTDNHRKSRIPVLYWPSIRKQAIHVASLTAIMLFVLNVFVPQNKIPKRGLASQALPHSQILDSKEFVKKLNKTFKNYPVPQRNVSSPSSKPLFFKGTRPETPDYKGF